ncbi:MAG: LysM domain-containing protein [Pirellulales bacterium]
MDPMQFLIAQAMQISSPFAENSRYRQTSIVTETLPDGKQVRRIVRRFLPQPESMATLADHKLKLGERLDSVAYQYLGDPELFWQVCDANRAMRPADLTDSPIVQNRPRQIRIGLPPGVPNSQSME